jgi:hypothetical protein
MPNSHVRNLKAPCHKESEPEKIVTEGNLTAAHGLSDKRFETGLTRLKIGSESSLAALRKNVSNGIEMIL